MLLYQFVCEPSDFIFKFCADHHQSDILIARNIQKKTDVDAIFFVVVDDEKDAVVALKKLNGGDSPVLPVILIADDDIQINRYLFHARFPKINNQALRFPERYVEYKNKNLMQKE